MATYVVLVQKNSRTEVEVTVEETTGNAYDYADQLSCIEGFMGCITLANARKLYERLGRMFNK